MSIIVLEHFNDILGPWDEDFNDPFTDFKVFIRSDQIVPKSFALTLACGNSEFSQERARLENRRARHDP